MKLSSEFYNGCIIFLGIGLYFFLMIVLGLADVFYLRLFNILFVLYGVNRTIEMNLSQGKTNFISNAISAMATSLTGVFLSVIGLIIYSYWQGGDSFVETLSQTFLFGGNPSVVTYCLGLLIEGIASSVIVTLSLMLYWNNHFVSD